jgi:hypothetical protein
MESRVWLKRHWPSSGNATQIGAQSTKAELQCRENRNLISSIQARSAAAFILPFRNAFKSRTRLRRCLAVEMLPDQPAW